MPGLGTVVLMVGFASSLLARDPFSGTWKLIPSKSAGRVPKDETVTIRESAGKLSFAVSIVDSRPGNSKFSIRYVVPAGGGIGPIENGPYNGVSVERVGPRNLTITYLIDGAKARSTQVVVAGDGQSMTSTGNAEGRSEPAAWVLVFEKQ